jgi:hypothetical protein
MQKLGVNFQQQSSSICNYKTTFGLCAQFSSNLYPRSVEWQEVDWLWSGLLEVDLAQNELRLGKGVSIYAILQTSNWKLSHVIKMYFQIMCAVLILC